MKSGLRNIVFLLTPPALSIALLAGIVREQGRHLKPADVEPYHASAKAAVDAVPYIIGYWTGQDDEIPVAAQKLLRPNVILSRTYSDNTPAGEMRGESRSVGLLIVQCRDSRDMIGHWPPICYRAHGMTMDAKYCSPRDWKVGETVISGYEYQFTGVFQGQTSRTIVYNFLIVPGSGIVRDMKGVEQAAEDYQQRYYGAAQFQVVFHGQASQQERDRTFATLMEPNLKLIETLTSGGLK